VTEVSHTSEKAQLATQSQKIWLLNTVATIHLAGVIGISLPISYVTSRDIFLYAIEVRAGLLPLILSVPFKFILSFQ